MMTTQGTRSVRWYFREFAPGAQGAEYVKKHSELIRLINEMMSGGSGDTIAVTSQLSLGDNETEFRESLRRIQVAELFLQMGGITHHPADLPMLQWSGPSHETRRRI